MVAKVVGGHKCLAMDDYALFSFKKMKALGKPTKDKPYVAYVISKEFKTSMIWAVCGSEFEPKAGKISPDDSLITDGFASCKKLAANRDTKGNVYLVKDGKCVQSFKYGKFQAKVTPADGEGKKPKQSWDLQYTSL